MPNAGRVAHEVKEPGSDYLKLRGVEKVGKKRTSARVQVYVYPVCIHQPLSASIRRREV